MRDDVQHLAHEGHQSNIKTKNRLRAKVWWPKMDAAAEKLCMSIHKVHDRETSVTFIPRKEWNVVFKRECDVWSKAPGNCYFQFQGSGVDIPICV